jgi:hypothetical protein
MLSALSALLVDGVAVSFFVTTGCFPQACLALTLSARVDVRVLWTEGMTVNAAGTWVWATVARKHVTIRSGFEMRRLHTPGVAACVMYVTNCVSICPCVSETVGAVVDSSYGESCVAFAVLEAVALETSIG